MNNVISFSGGKDSTAMLHMMLDRGELIHSVVFFDAGWEFPEMLDHIDLVERKTGVKVIRLHPHLSFDYWMFERPIISRNGTTKGQVHRIGNGWPSPSRRWCTREKVQTINKYQKTVSDCVPCIGIAFDEFHRCKPGPQRYPLIVYGITEPEAIRYCRKLGYTWGGLYDIFYRLSCWCCPLQSLKVLRKLRKYRPELWQRLLDMDKNNPIHNKGFKDYRSVSDLEYRFLKEEKQLSFFSFFPINDFRASLAG